MRKFFLVVFIPVIALIFISMRTSPIEAEPQPNQEQILSQIISSTTITSVASPKPQVPAQSAMVVSGPVSSTLSATSQTNNSSVIPTTTTSPVIASTPTQSSNSIVPANPAPDLSPVVIPAIAKPSTSVFGFLEKSTAENTRPRLSAQIIQGFLPERGKFTFPAPYNTEAARITNSSDCGGTDCVAYAGYSYWRNMNNHVGRDSIYMFVGLKNNGGPTLFSYKKSTSEVTKVGPIFPSSSPLASASGEGWYFSGTQATKLYVWRSVDTKFYRYDVESKTLEIVLDIAMKQDVYGANRYIWQMHSSDDDRVHIGTIRDNSSYAMLGCFAYQENSNTYSYYPKKGALDECNLDGSGRWLVMLDGEDNRIIDLITGTETVIPDKEGALGHMDMGDGYAVGSDNWNTAVNATVLIKFPLTSTTRPVSTVVHANPDWKTAEANHVSHQNRKSGVAPESQYACGSNVDNVASRENEIVCFKLDGSFRTLVVAPVMTNLSASGGGDSYAKYPKGNLDVTGEYFFWTSNMGGPRLDAFIVKIPYSKL